MNKLSNLKELYISYLEVEKNASKKTIENYNLWINRFIEYSGNVKANEVNKVLILNYRKHLQKKGLSLKTINYHIVSLRAFFKFLLRNDIDVISPDKLELAKTSPRTVNYLEEKEIEKLLLMPDEYEKKHIKKIRDKTILLILFGSGLRVSELINLKHNNIKLESNQFWVIGKGSKLRAVFMIEKAKKALEEYLNMKASDSEYIFSSLSNNNVNKPLNRVSIEKIVKRYARLAGIQKKVTPHTLRHSFATSLLLKGADIRSVQTLLGHSSITTTQIYTHIADVHLQKIHDLLND
ncbi:MAG: site-specific tyrosine recombinase/integron integrase [Candidatus Absconditabacteria bacterium]